MMKVLGASIESTGRGVKLATFFIVASKCGINRSGCVLWVPSNPRELMKGSNDDGSGSKSMGQGESTK